MSNTKWIQQAYASICKITRDEVVNWMRNWGKKQGEVEVEIRGVKICKYCTHALDYQEQ